MKLKSYIALSTDKDFSTAFHQSRVNNISQISVSPKQLHNTNAPRTYIRKLTTGGLFFGTIVTIGVITAAAALLK